MKKGIQYKHWILILIEMAHPKQHSGCVQRKSFSALFFWLFFENGRHLHQLVHFFCVRNQYLVQPFICHVSSRKKVALDSTIGYSLQPFLDRMTNRFFRVMLHPDFCTWTLAG